MSTIRGRQLQAHFAVTRNSSGNLVFEEYSTATSWVTDTDKIAFSYPTGKGNAPVWAGTATESQYLSPPSGTYADWSSNVEKTDLDYLTNGGNFAIGFQVARQTSSNQVFNRYFDNVLLVNAVNTGSFVINVEANNNTTTQSSVTIVATPGTLQTGTNQGVASGEVVYRWLYDTNVIGRQTIVPTAGEWPGPIIAPVYDSQYILASGSYVASSYITTDYFIEETGDYCSSTLENGVSYTVDPLEYVLGPFYFPDAQLVPPVTELGQTTATSTSSMVVLAGFAIFSGTATMVSVTSSTQISTVIRSGSAQFQSTSSVAPVVVKINQTHQGTATTTATTVALITGSNLVSITTQTYQAQTVQSALAAVTAGALSQSTATTEVSVTAARTVGGTLSAQSTTTMLVTAANLIDFGVTYAGVGYCEPGYWQELVNSRYFTTDYLDPDYVEDILVQIETLSTSTLFAEPSVEIIIVANVQADSQITAQPGYLITAGTVTVSSTTTEFLNYTGLQGGPGVILGSTQAAFTSTSLYTVSGAIDHSAAATLAVAAQSQFSSGIIFRPPASLAADATATMIPSLRLGTTSTMQAKATVPNILAGYGLFAQALIQSQGFQLSAGKIVILDDYYLLLVPPETRIWELIPEIRTALVLPETAEIDLIPEPKTVLVAPETAIYKIAVAPAEQIGNRTRRIEQ